MLNKMLETFIAITVLGRKEEDGATATEYALLVAFIAFLIIAGVTFFGNALSGFFSNLGGTVSGWVAPE